MSAKFLNPKIILQLNKILSSPGSVSYVFRYTPKDFYFDKIPLNSHIASFSITGFPACSTKNEFLVGWAGEPAHKSLIENGARFQFKQRLKKRLREHEIPNYFSSWGCNPIFAPSGDLSSGTIFLKFDNSALLPGFQVCILLWKGIQP